MKCCNPLEDLMPFTYTNASKCINEPGIYSFWFNGKCIYVGKTEKQGVRDRLIQHWSRSHNERLRDWLCAKKNKMMFCYRIFPINKVDKMERICIHKYQPIANVMLVTHTYVDINDGEEC